MISNWTETAEPKIIVPIKSGPSIKKLCPDPVAEIQAAQMAMLDPTGVRTRMFDYENKEGAKVGDILHTTFKTGEPFSGVIMSIKSRRQDTSVLVRNHLTHVGAEMSIKVFSPNVASMEIVQRSQKRKRRARLYYLRKPKVRRNSVLAQLKVKRPTTNDIFYKNSTMSVPLTRSSRHT